MSTDFLVYNFRIGEALLFITSAEAPPQILINKCIPQVIGYTNIYLYLYYMLSN